VQINRPKKYATHSIQKGKKKRGGREDGQYFTPKWDRILLQAKIQEAASKERVFRSVYREEAIIQMEEAGKMTNKLRKGKAKKDNNRQVN